MAKLRGLNELIRQIEILKATAEIVRESLDEKRSWLEDAKNRKAVIGDRDF